MQREEIHIHKTYMSLLFGKKKRNGFASEGWIWWIWWRGMDLKDLLQAELKSFWSMWSIQESWLLLDCRSWEGSSSHPSERKKERKTPGWRSTWGFYVARAWVFFFLSSSSSSSSSFSLFCQVNDHMCLYFYHLLLCNESFFLLSLPLSFFSFLHGNRECRYYHLSSWFGFLEFGILQEWQQGAAT